MHPTAERLEQLQAYCAAQGIPVLVLLRPQHGGVLGSYKVRALGQRADKEVTSATAMVEAVLAALGVPASASRTLLALRDGSLDAVAAVAPLGSAWAGLAVAAQGQRAAAVPDPAAVVAEPKGGATEPKAAAPAGDARATRFVTSFLLKSDTSFK